MSELLPSAPGGHPESLDEAFNGRLVSVVHIMKGRHSILSSLGVLKLDQDALSLRDAKGSLLFAVPVTSVEARPRRRLAIYQTFFEVHAADRWWNLVAWAPTKYQRRSTRELAERSGARELVPRPPALSEGAYQQLTKNPVRHQILWKQCWLAVLRTAGELSNGGSPSPMREDP